MTARISKRTFGHALEALMESKEYSEISISELAQTAGLSRKTFYNYFKDKDDLVSWYFRSEVFKKRTVADDDNFWLVLKGCLTALSAKPEFYLALFKEPGANSMRETLRCILLESMNGAAFVVFLPEELTTAQRKLIARSMIGVLVDMIVEWLKLPQREAPHEFVQSLRKLIDCCSGCVAEEKKREAGNLHV